METSEIDLVGTVRSLTKKVRVNNNLSRKRKNEISKALRKVRRAKLRELRKVLSNVILGEIWLPTLVVEPSPQ